MRLGKFRKRLSLPHTIDVTINHHECVESRTNSVSSKLFGIDL